MKEYSIFRTNESLETTIDLRTNYKLTCFFLFGQEIKNVVYIIYRCASRGRGCGSNKSQHNPAPNRVNGVKQSWYQHYYANINAEIVFVIGIGE